MKIINVMAAKSVWLFALDDLNPRGKDVAPELLEWIKDNYHFDKAPSSVAEIDQATRSFKFERGRFQVKEEIYITVNLEIYNDGIVGVSQSSTRDTDAFLEDLLTLAAKDFSLAYTPDMIRRKMYVSELNVRLDADFCNLNPELATLADKISEYVGTGVPPFEPSGVVIGDDAAISVFKPAAFYVERKAGAPFSEKRYYSRAPLHTDQHEEILADLEAILADKENSPNLESGIIRTPKRAIHLREDSEM